MSTHVRHVVWVAVGLALAGCQERAISGDVVDGQVAITIAPLDLSSLVDVAYDLSVENSQGQVVWTRPGIRASDFGNGTGLAFVGPCDADPTVQPNVVKVDIVALYDVDGLVPSTAWHDPTETEPLRSPANCVANADVPANFSVTVVRAANQGFFDVAVSFNDIFCSAKFDCHTAGSPLELVHAIGGDRAPSAVLGLACTAGPGQDTWLYLDDLLITCDGDTTVIPVDQGPGNLYSDASAPPAPLHQAMVFRGLEQPTDGQGGSLQKRYVNVAMAIDFLATSTACTLTTAATAHDGAFDDGVTPAGTYPVIRYEVPLVNGTGDGYGCGQMQLDDPAGVAGDRVATTYVFGPPGTQLDVGFGAVGDALIPVRSGPATCDEPSEEGLCQGVCALQSPDCVNGQYVCNGTGYEAVEVSCDGFDNDCDGAVDEDDVCATSCDETGTCATCRPNLSAARANLTAMADIDFDFDCNTYLTTLRSGADFTTIIETDGTATSYLGNANQNMTFALVDPDPDNRRVVVTYSCCQRCGCQAKNGVTLLYNCEPTDPGCGCAGQTNCPGFLDQAFVTTGYADTSVTSITSPTGLAAGPGNRYYVGNFRSDMCSNAPTCVACDETNPNHWCTPSADNCCADHTMGRLAEFTLPEPGVEPTWRLAYDFAPEQVIGLASARDGSVLVGTYASASSGNLWRYDPVSRSATLLASHSSHVFSITQNRSNGDIYAEIGGSADPRIFRYLEDGTPAALPPGVPSAPSGRGVLQYGPDGPIYRLKFYGAGPLDVYDLSSLPKSLHLSADVGVTATSGAVSAWADQGIGRVDGVQTNAARQPQLIDNALNGRPVIRFDGTDDMFILASNLFASTNTSYTVVAVLKTTDAEAHILGTGSSGGGFLLSYGNALIVTGGLATVKSNNSSGVRFSGDSIDDDAGHIVIGVVTTGASSVSVDDGAPATDTGNPNPFAYSRSTIGASDGSASGQARDPFAGDIAELIVIPGVIGPANQAAFDQLVADLASKYGLTGP